MTKQDRTLASAKMRWNVLSRPPNSKDLGPFDYHLCGPLKDAILENPFAETAMD
jgi:hypothetical protein